MKIVMIAEGSYPYVVGGVASWMHGLISAMPEHEFEIVAISADPASASELRYRLPANVTKVHDYYITETDQQKGARRPKLNKQELSDCLDWFDMIPGSEKALRLLADKKKFGDPIAFLQHDAFWEQLVESYRSETPDGSFEAYFRSWRSMYLPANHLLQRQYPRADLYHAVSAGYAGLIGTHLKITRGTPFVLTEHGFYAMEREEEIMRSSWLEPALRSRWIRYFRHLSHAAYKQADKTVALYNGASRVQTGLGVREENAVVIPNGVDFDALSRLPRQPDAAKFVFGAIARVVPIKDMKTLLYAAKIANAAIPNMELRIIGPTDEDPGYHAECVSLMRQLQLEPIVTFTGAARIEDELPRIDALVLSSLSEGQPLAVLEGMAAGLPWICTDVGSCRELLEGKGGADTGKAGLLVPTANPRALAESILFMHAHPDMRLQMGNAGRRRVATYYRHDRLIEAYRKLYSEAVK